MNRSYSSFHLLNPLKFKLNLIIALCSDNITTKE